MEPRFDAAREPSAHAVWTELVQPLGEWLCAEARPVATAAVAEIQETFPELFPADDDFEENRAASEANIRLLGEILARGRDPREVQVPPPAVAYLRDGVHHGVPLASFLRSLRLGQAALSRALLARLNEQAADRAKLALAIDLTSAWTFAFVDVLATTAEEVYTEERDRWLRTAAAAQTETIEALMAGGDVDRDAGSRRLRYDLNRTHLAVVGWFDQAEEGRDTIATLEHVLGECARGLGSEPPLLEPLGLLAVAGWMGSHSAFDDAVIDALRFDTQAGRGARLALGEPAPGVAGFTRTHRQALHARRVATLAGRPPGTVTRYRRVALQAMATTDAEQAHDFVQRELGALAASDDAAHRLLATLQIFLEEGSSYVRTSKRLGIHENTVRYRVRQAEDLLGRKVEERTLDLRVALALLNVARPPVSP